ncbi:MAG: hypothetical protein PHN19_02815 [Patescibacteria group bacterium]|nr:hypothetical protein [Patescibacteria group bacterium]
MKKIYKIYRKFEKTNLLQFCPIVLGFSIGKNRNRRIKFFFKNAYAVIKEGNGIFYWKKENFERTLSVLNSLIEKKPKYSIELLRQIEKKAKEIKKMTSKVHKLKLNKKGNQEIVKLLHQLYKIEAEWADLLTVPNILILEFREKMSDSKENLLKSRQKPGYFESLVAEIKIIVDHSMDLIIKEISRRTFYSVNQLNFALPIEIKDILNKRGLKRYELEERQKLCLLQYIGNNKLKITVGDKAKKIIKKCTR